MSEDTSTTPEMPTPPSEAETQPAPPDATATACITNPAHRKIALIQLVLAYLVLIPALIGMFYWFLLIREYGTLVIAGAPLFLLGALLFYWYHVLYGGHLAVSRAKLYWIISIGYNLMLGATSGFLAMQAAGENRSVMLGCLALMTVQAAAVALGVLGINAVDSAKKAN